MDLDFPKGTSAQAMAEELAARAWSDMRWQFCWYARCIPASGCKPENISSHMPTPRGVFNRIVRGDVFFYV